LSLFINGKYTLHKIETTTKAEGSQIKSESQTMSLNPPSITIGQLIDNTLQKIGPQRFTKYNPLS
jgi:hypothetical protein